MRERKEGGKEGRMEEVKRCRGKWEEERGKRKRGEEGKGKR